MRLKNVPGAREAIAESDLVIKNPQELKGKWREFWNNDKEIHIEVGMGKGKFMMGMAKEHPEINFSGNTLSVKYKNWLCRYQAEAGTICDTGKVGYNRNGHYAIFSIRGKERAAVIIEITCVK